MVDYSHKAPVYASVRSFNELVNNPGLRHARLLDTDALLALGVTQGTVPSMLSAIRFLGWVDDDGLVLDDDFYRLNDREPVNERAAAFERILTRAYSDLLNDISPDQLNSDDVHAHFVRHGSSDHVARKATHFFIWFATQAGFDIAENVRKYRASEQPMIATASSIREETMDEMRRTLDSDDDPYEEQLLTVLLKRMEQAEDMSTILDAAKLFDKILQRREARRKNS